MSKQFIQSLHRFGWSSSSISSSHLVMKSSDWSVDFFLFILYTNILNHCAVGVVDVSVLAGLLYLHFYIQVRGWIWVWVISRHRLVGHLSVPCSSCLNMFIMFLMVHKQFVLKSLLLLRLRLLFLFFSISQIPKLLQNYCSFIERKTNWI